MLKLKKEEVKNLKEKFTGRKIAVVGDMMLDSYLWGDVKRISPEAPVPVIEIDDEFYRFGGAANVALNIQKLGGYPIPIGIIGYDNEGSIFSGLMEEAGISSEGIILDDERPTTAKTRVIAGKQHIVRIDRESKNFLKVKLEGRILNLLERMNGELDAIILQDYNKGVLSPALINKVIAIANKNNIVVTVDPKFDNFFEYKNVTVFKPNRKETADILGTRLDSSKEIEAAGRKLLDELNSKYVLITLGEAGIALFEKDKETKRIPTKAVKVSDVSGAGDTVISTLTIALAAGIDIESAAYLANFAGGIVCGEVGIVPIETDTLINKILSEMDGK